MKYLIHSSGLKNHFLNKKLQKYLKPDLLFRLRSSKMAQINTFLRKLVPLLKTHAEYSQKTANDFNALVLEVEEIFLDVEAPNNQVPEEEEEYDLEAVIVEFDEMMMNNPIQDLWEIMAKRNLQVAEEGAKNISLEESDLQSTSREVEQNIPLDESDCHIQINPNAIGHEGREIKIEECDWDLQGVSTMQIEEIEERQEEREDSKVE